MSKIDGYRAELRKRSDWQPYLLRESGLPGPRGNLELAAAAVEEAAPGALDAYLRYGPMQAPEGTAEEYLAFCGVLGLSVRLPDAGQLRRLRSWASDPRWRIREAVAMALQRYGDRDMIGLLDALRSWVDGNCLERRAAVAAVAEPRLLANREHARSALRLVDQVTRSLLPESDRRDSDFRSLRQGLGYAWSVIVAALPEAGRAAMERWFSVDDPDVRWVMRENLGKNRLSRLDPVWAARWRDRLR